MRIIWKPKLVRDHIPAQIFAQGGYCLFHSLEGAAYRKALLKKLVEEAKEVLHAGKGEERIKELGDLLDVAETIRIAFGIPEKELAAWRRMKQNTAGAFAKGFKLYFAIGGKRK